MLPEAVARYHDLLADHDLAESSRAMLDEAGDLQKPLKPISAYFDGHYIATAR